MQPIALLGEILEEVGCCVLGGLSSPFRHRKHASAPILHQSSARPGKHVLTTFCPICSPDTAPTWMN